MNPEPVSMAQPWKCEACGASGLLLHWSSDDSAEIVRECYLLHARGAPFGCPANLRFGERYLANATPAQLQAEADSS